MTESFDVNYRGKWIEVRTTRDGYQYVHSVPNKGMGIAVLGYFRDGHTASFLARFEICPAHGRDTACCSLTGMVDPGEPPKTAAVRELEEESGYVVHEASLIFLGTTYPSKMSDTVVYMYAVDLSGLSPQTAQGDGSMLESVAYCRAVDMRDILRSKDPILHSLALQLSAHEDF